jgi:hypothetical protein
MMGDTSAGFSGERLAALRAAWERDRMVRIEGGLPEGLAAELACYLPTLPLAPRLVAQHLDLSWSCELEVPEAYDPQHPRCLYRLVRFLDVELPALVEQVTGRALAPPRPRTVHVWQLRRGAYVDQGQPLGGAGSIDVLIGLTGERWPAAWGGHLQVGARSLAPGFATLDLLGGQRFHLPLLRRHVRTLAVRTFLS